MPATFTLSRRLRGGFFRTAAASTNILTAVWSTDGRYKYTHPTTLGLDINVANAGTAAVTRTLNAPTGINLIAVMNVSARGASAGAGTAIYLSDLATTDVAAGFNGVDTSVSPLVQIGHSSDGTDTVAVAGQVHVRTNTSAQIRSRQGANDAQLQLKIQTIALIDAENN